MLESIYLDPDIHKSLDLLQRSDKKAALAATKAGEIIGRLQSGQNRLIEAGTVTKHGEARIKGVVKYDLGSGYRLITFKQGDTLYLLFVGNHDDCHRWIENNRELNRQAIIEQIRQRCILPVENSGCRPSPSFRDELPVLLNETEEDSLPDIAEGELRRVFCGLVEGV